MSTSKSDANENNADDPSKVFEFLETGDAKVEPIILKSCQICGRTFNPKSLERHEKVCATAKKSNHRNVFNSFLQRAKELNAIPTAVEKQKEERVKLKGKYKDQHENSVHTCRTEKNPHSYLLNNGLSLQKTIPPGYTQCPSCHRCFSVKAADRHITWCQEQQTRLPKTPPNSEALERLKARVKYQAPLPRKKNYQDSKRLVKSADSIRECSNLHTHSSLSSPLCNVIGSKQTLVNSCNPIKMQQKRANKSASCRTSNNNSSPLSRDDIPELKNKKSVKFKEKLSGCDEERNKNLDILAALKLRLTELKTSDDFLEECISRTNANQEEKVSKKYCFPVTPDVYKDTWTSDDRSLPSVSDSGSSERRLPRFCYNCGTKYPIVSAKFCCECGARRFIFGSNDNELQVA